jgi:hypothetical protein
MQPAVPPGKEY